jgi:hypothetical protein
MIKGLAMGGASGRRTGAEARRKRLEEALRGNLAKRKDQVRGRSEAAHEAGASDAAEAGERQKGKT